MIDRLLAISFVDARFRFRRTATVVILLIVGMTVYLIVPEISSGRALMEIEGRRVIYSSVTIAMATAILCSLLLSLLGTYLAGNSFRRDLLARTAYVIAGTPVHNSEYVIGKFIGGALYLGAILLACMVSSIIMFLIRGEGNFEPLAFLGIYLWIGIPTVFFCAAAALLFESVPFLSGRMGDVLYFFLWGALLGLPVAMLETNGGPQWLRLFDITGIVPIIEITRTKFHTLFISIGSNSFKSNLPPLNFGEIDWSWRLIADRCSTFVVPLFLLIVTVNVFHRFDPSRKSSTVRYSRKNLMTSFNVLLKPLTRFLLMGTGNTMGKRSSFLQDIRADVLATFMLSPIAVVALIVVTVLSLSLELSSLQEGLLPVIIVILIIILSDVAVRDYSANTLKLLFTAPGIQKNFVWLKFFSATVLAVCFTGIPILRLWAGKPAQAISLLVGTCFLSAGAVCLGIAIKSQKAFIVLYLMLVYIALNAKEVASFDFAGFTGAATSETRIAYAALTMLFLLFAQARFSLKVRAM